MAFPCLEHFNGFPLPGIKESSLRSVSLLTSPDLPLDIPTLNHLQFLKDTLFSLCLQLSHFQLHLPGTTHPGKSGGKHSGIPYMHWHIIPCLLYPLAHPLALNNLFPCEGPQGRDCVLLITVFSELTIFGNIAGAQTTLVD